MEGLKGSGENGDDRYRTARNRDGAGDQRLQFVNEPDPLLLALWQDFAPEEREVGQGVGELLIRHPRVWKHPCARVSFPDCTRALLVSLEVQHLRISQIYRWRIELSDERGGVGCELRSLGLVPITAMALMGIRTNDRNSQPTPLRSSLNSILHRSI